MTPPSAPPQRRSRLRRDLRWLVPATLAVLAVCVWMLMLEPEEANSVATILGILLGGLGVILAVLLRPEAAHRGDHDEGATEAPALSRRTLLLRVIFAAVLTVLVAAFGVAVWRFATTSAIVVTADIEVLGAKSMRDGATATVAVPGEPPSRGRVTLVAVLSNTTSTGACVDPARLTMTPVVDGRPGTSAVGHSGEPVEVSIEGALRTAEVMIMVAQADPACVVDLHIDRAVLHG